MNPCFFARLTRGVFVGPSKDNSGKLTLDEIDEDAAKLWLTFKLPGATPVKRWTLDEGFLVAGSGFNHGKWGLSQNIWGT
jgi:hypothetical protein